MPKNNNIKSELQEFKNHAKKFATADEDKSYKIKKPNNIQEDVNFSDIGSERALLNVPAQLDDIGISSSISPINLDIFKQICGNRTPNFFNSNPIPSQK